MKSEIKKIIEKEIEKYDIKEIKISNKKYSLYIVPELCDEDLNIFEGFLFIETESRNEVSYLKTKYRPPVSGYTPRLGIIFYDGHLLIKDYRRNRHIIKTLKKINKTFLTKLKKALSEPKEENLSELFDRTDIIEEFYILYKKAREYLLKNISGISEEEKREKFVDNFMMQMLTLWYLQERGFFNNDKNYFITKFKELSQKKLFNGFKNYYEFLVYLFKKINGHEDKQYIDDPYVGKLVVIGPAVFLNGEQSKAISISDKCFYKKGLTDIFINTPPKKVSQEVPLLNLFESRDWTEGNIDEFVLGAIYEKLITYMERKKLGAYYTPEEITSYICKNTIEPYLVDRVNEKFSKKFESVDQIIESNNKEILFYLFEQLREIKILDPAVGSAHFLESAINILVSIYEKIWEKVKELNIKKGLEIVATDEKGEIKEINLLNILNEDKLKLLVKFYIILSKNIYGVDINPSALKVAKARLFLTLAKHFKAQKDKEIFIRFPNVHFNLREGNSLIGNIEIGKKIKEIQLQFELFVKEEQADYITEKIKVVSSLKPYLEKTAKALKISGNIVKEIDELNKVLSRKKINWDDFEKVLRTKEKLIKILIVSLNSKYAMPLNDLLREITELFNQKLDEKFAENHKIDLSELKKIRTFHWIFEFPEVFLDRGGFDVVVENPPWNAVKPVEKEFFSDYDPRLTKYGVDKKEARRIISNLLNNPNIKQKWEEYKKKIEIEAKFYKSSGIYKYQSDEINGKRVGGDINSYKLFLERSYQLLTPKGFFGIIIPSGLHTDAGTKGIRKLFFDNGNVFCVYNFENRKGIFDEIHKSFKFDLFIVKKEGMTHNFFGAFMLHDVEILSNMPEKALKLEWDTIKRISPDSLSIIEFKMQKDVEIASKLLKHPLLKDNHWLGKVELFREFDMTNDSELFNTEGKGLILYEGKMIEQYNPYFEENRYWIEEKKGKDKLYGKNIRTDNFDYKEYRLGFRAVASSTNRRSMIASLLPKNVFCGNSIIVLKIYDKNGSRLISEDKLLYLCGIFNSFVFDYFLRLKITTNLNMFFIYQMPIPTPSEDSVNEIIKCVLFLTEAWNDFKELREKFGINGKKLDKNNRIRVQAEIDAIIGKLYGLSKEDMKYILDKFHHKDFHIEQELRTLEELILSCYN